MAAPATSGEICLSARPSESIGSPLNSFSSSGSSSGWHRQQSAHPSTQVYVRPSSSERSTTSLSSSIGYNVPAPDLPGLLLVLHHQLPSDHDGPGEHGWHAFERCPATFGVQVVGPDIASVHEVDDDEISIVPDVYPALLDAEYLPWPLAQPPDDRSQREVPVPRM